MKRNKSAIFGLFLILLIIIIIFIPHILSGNTFSYGYDIRHQYYPFYTEFKSIITASLSNFRFPFYSWNIFLGSNFWASKSYYLLGDIYNYLFLAVNSSYYSIRFLQTILKIFISSFTFYLYFKSFNYKKSVTLLGVLSYTFSFWFIHYSEQPIFISFYSFVPLYFLGIEEFLKSQKKYLFLFSTMILMFTNYYLFFTVSIFTVLYYIYRYSIVKSNFDRFWKDTRLLIFYYFVGIFSTLFVTLPTFFYIFNNDRVGTITLSLFYSDIRVYLNLINSWLTPNVFQNIPQQNPFIMIDYRVNEICMWAGSYIALLVPQVLLDRDKVFKKNTTLFYCILVMFILIPTGGMIMHGFSESTFRWLFLFMIMNIIIAGRYLDNAEMINKRALFATLVFSISLLLIVSPLTNIITNSEYGIFSFSYLVSLLSCLLIGGIYCGIRFAKTKMMKMIIVITSFELCLFGMHYMLYDYEPHIYKEDFVNRQKSVLQDYPGELTNFIRENDEEWEDTYYRIYVPFHELYWGYSYNMSAIYGIHGVMTYDSTLSPAINDMTFFEEEDIMGWLIDFRNPELLNFISVKYAVIGTESSLPEGNYAYLGEYRYGLQVYRNEDYLSIGETYTKIRTYDELASNSSKHLEEYIIVKDEFIKNEIEPYLNSTNRYNMENVVYGGNQLSGVVFTDEKSFLIIKLPFDEGWKIGVNGNKTKKYNVNGGMIGIPLELGENKIEMFFMPKGFKEGAVISFFAMGIIVSMSLIDLWNWKENSQVLNRKRRRDGAKDIGVY